MAIQPKSTTEEILLAKLKPSDLTEMVKQSGRSDENQHVLRMEVIKTARGIVYLGIAGLVIVCVTFIVTGHPELLQSIIIGLLGIGTGTGVRAIWPRKGEPPTG